MLPHPSLCTFNSLSSAWFLDTSIGHFGWHHLLYRNDMKSLLARETQKETKLIISTVPADDIAPLGAMASAGTVMTWFASLIYVGPALESFNSMSSGDEHLFKPETFWVTNMKQIDLWKAFTCLYYTQFIQNYACFLIFIAFHHLRFSLMIMGQSHDCSGCS